MSSRSLGTDGFNDVRRLRVTKALDDVSENLIQYKGTGGTKRQTLCFSVMPILNALGYDIFDPKAVEFDVCVGGVEQPDVDILLYSDGRPLLAVYCKPLGSFDTRPEFDIDALSLESLQSKGIKLIVVSDGYCLRLYNLEGEFLKSYCIDTASEADVDDLLNLSSRDGVSALVDDFSPLVAVYKCIVKEIKETIDADDDHLTGLQGSLDTLFDVSGLGLNEASSRKYSKLFLKDIVGYVDNRLAEISGLTPDSGLSDKSGCFKVDRGISTAVTGKVPVRVKIGSESYFVDSWKEVLGVIINYLREVALWDDYRIYEYVVPQSRRTIKSISSDEDKEVVASAIKRFVDTGVAADTVASRLRVLGEQCKVDCYLCVLTRDDYTLLAEVMGK